MGKYDKVYEHILLKKSDSNVDFQDLCNLLVRLGYSQRIRGSHHIFSADERPEILNVQSKNGKGKAYQVKQVREIILKYNLKLERP